jgi:hypothetical protein
VRAAFGRLARWPGAALLLAASIATAKADFTPISFCNNFKQRLYIALAYQQDDSSWISRGWLEVQPGTCRVFDSAIHLVKFYWRAESAWYVDSSSGKKSRTLWGDKGRMKFAIVESAHFNLYQATAPDSRSQLAGFIEEPGAPVIFHGIELGATIIIEADGSVTFRF